ncbi:MAG: ABC transporter substrate-binding protein [Desulfarculus sp.]|jgi:branched-chain amino acid transport system substrate-binding protein|nr:MAG: ABC transporter substrate-binding protein [Desulfarculus sp.]
MPEHQKGKGKGVSRRTFFKTTGVAAGAAALGGFHFVRKSQAASGPLKLGCPLPLTGPYGTEALDQQAGAALAVAEVNKNGGVLGRKVELVVRDTKLKADEAARRAKELIESVKVELMTGCLSAANQLAVNEQCKLVGMPYMSISQSNEITERRDASVYTYHEALDPHTTTQAVGKWAAQKFGKRWYFLTSDYAFGWQLTDGFRRVGKMFGVQDVGETKHPLGTADFSSYFPRIMAAKPDVLIIDNFGKDQLNTIKQATSFGLKKKIQLLCPVLLASARLGAGTAAYEGVVGGTSFYWEQNHPTAKKFVAAFQKANGRPPIDYAGYAYSGVLELLNGVNRAGKLDALALATAIENRNYDNYKGKQWWRPCDHQSQQDVFILRSKTPKKKYDVFEIIDTVSGANEALLRTCVELGHKPGVPNRTGLKK